MYSIITSVGDYIAEINKIYNGIHQWPKIKKHLFFRGHCDTEFLLKPSVFRKLKFEEREIFLDYKQYAPSEAVFYDYNTEKEKLLVQMQHYKIPTRLLDWTVAPLNALFFACCEKVDKIGQVIVFDPWKYWIENVRDKNHPEIHQIHIAARTLMAAGWQFLNINDHIKDKFSYTGLTPEDIENPFPFVATFTNKRVLHQRGCFTIHGKCRVEMDNIKSAVECIVGRIDIPAANKDDIIKELNHLYINDYTVYPDFEGMSDMVNRNGGLFNI